MAYTFEQIFAADPATPERVASNGVITIFAPGDASKTPLPLTTVDGMALSNPIKVNDAGFGPAFIAPIDRVGWEGGGYSGFFTSYDGLKQEAVAAREDASAARMAAASAALEAQAPTDAMVERGIQRADIPGRVSDAVLTEAPVIVGGVSVTAFGAAGNGLQDDTTKIQNAIDHAAQRVISSGMVDSGTVRMPSGRYKITKRIIQPPYVKIVTLGTVIIESYVEADSAWHITPLATDPERLYGQMQKQQWLRGALINAQVGGFVIINRAQIGATVGLELGPRKDLGLARPLSRYTLNDIAIQGFQTAQQMNVFQHFIAHFYRFHLESNGTNIRIGTGTPVTFNSGENFTWVDSVIASADFGVVWDSDVCDVTFRGCSLDFLGTVAKFNFGWNRLLIDGGHIEGANEDFRRTPRGGIAVSAVETGTLPDVVIQGITPYVARERSTLFRGRMGLWLEMAYRNNGDLTRVGVAENILCDDLVEVRHLAFTSPTGGPIPSRQLNMVYDGALEKEDVGTASTALTNFTRTQSCGDVVETISTAGPRPGSKSLKHVIKGSAFHRLAPKAYIPCEPGQRLYATMSFLLEGPSVPSLAIVGEFFDSERRLISSTEAIVFRQNEVKDVWRAMDRARFFTAPPGVAYFRPCFQVATSAGDGQSAWYISDLTELMGSAPRGGRQAVQNCRRRRLLAAHPSRKIGRWE